MMKVTPALRRAAARSCARFIPAEVSGGSLAGCAALSACRTRTSTGKSSVARCATDGVGAIAKVVASKTTASVWRNPTMDFIDQSSQTNRLENYSGCRPCESAKGHQHVRTWHKAAPARLVGHGSGY